MIRTLNVEGRPSSQGSKRIFNGRIVEQLNDTVKAWRKAIGVAAAKEPAPTFTGPVKVQALFKWTRPKAHYRSNGLLHDTAPTFKATVPDIDKVLRCTLDGLVEHGVIADDCLVVSIDAEKDWTSGPPGAFIIISDMA